MMIYRLRALNVFNQWHESFFSTRKLAQAYLDNAIKDGDFLFIKDSEPTITLVWVTNEL